MRQQGETDAEIEDDEDEIGLTSLFGDQNRNTSDVLMSRDSDDHTSDVPKSRRDFNDDNRQPNRENMLQKAIVRKPQDLSSVSNLDETLIYDFDDTEQLDTDMDMDTSSDRIQKRTRRRPAYLDNYTE